ncbi:hypothetical protein [Paludisphaera rhizosphaerae]|nr:hypothetical protein [Paludisphaera rhizosphaerae]
MNPPTYAASDRRDQILTRALAVILFGLAGLMGLILAVGTAASLASGRWGILTAVAVVGPILVLAFWVARLLWANRPIPVPPWVVGVLLMICLPIAAVQFAMADQWLVATFILIYGVPALPPMFAMVSRKTAKPKPKPKVFDDLA